MQRRTLSILILCLVGLFTGLFFYYVRFVFVPFGLAIIMAYIIYPLVRSLENRGVNRTKSILTVYAAGLIIAGIFFGFFVPALYQELKSFASIIPVYIETWARVQSFFDKLLTRTYLPPEAYQILKETIGDLRSSIFEGMRSFAQMLIEGLYLLPSFLLALFLAYYIIRDFDHLKKKFLAFLPPNLRSDLLFLLREGDLIFSQFLRGHLLISLIVGFLTGIGAALLKIPFAILIGIFTAIADLIPVFGPILAAIPVVGFALSISSWKGVLMLGIFLLVQQIEGSILTPRLLGELVGLHPLATVFVLLVGGYLAGPLGLIFAVPAAGLLKVIIGFIWEKII